MANKIMKFHSEVLGFNTRARYFGNTAWFYAADVCKCLELPKVSQAISSLDDDEKLILESYGKGDYKKVPVDGY